MSQRGRSKYPALDPALNLKGRRDYIEPEYVSGVFDNNGVLVIRPLNHEEKAWLNKFYQETIITAFNKDGTDFYNSVDARRELWRENNRRNVCLYNKMKKMGKLRSLDAMNLDLEKIDLEDLQNPETIMILLEQLQIKDHDELMDFLDELEED